VVGVGWGWRGARGPQGAPRESAIEAVYRQSAASEVA
jgi:hypothetical protein